MRRYPRLPARAVPLAGESLTSFVRRNALAMGYDGLRRILSLAEGVQRPANLDQLGPGKALSALADLLGSTEATLLGLTAHRFTDCLMLVPRGGPPVAKSDTKTLLRFFTGTQAAYCPRCLSEPPVYQRLLWSFRALPLCGRHGTLLRSHCPKCLKPVVHRLDIAHCRCGQRLDENDAGIEGSQAIEIGRLVEQWVAGAAAPLPGVSTAAGFWWLERLRVAIVRAPYWLTRGRFELGLSVHAGNEAVAWLVAAQLLATSPGQLETFFGTSDKLPDPQSNRALRMLGRDAHRLEQLGHAVPANTLREFLLAHFTAGHLSRKSILFRAARYRKQLEQRPWLTQTQAGRLLQVRLGTIAALIKRKVLAGQIHSAGKKGRTIGLVSRSSVEKLKLRLASTLSTCQVGKRLGVERHRVLEWIHEGAWPDAIRSARGWRVPAKSVNEFLAGFERAPILGSSRTGWITLANATRRFGPSGLSLVRLVALIQSGQVTARRTSANSSLAGLWVSSADLERLAPEILSDRRAKSSYSLNQLARVIFPGRSLKDVVLRKWIAAGLLHGKRGRKSWHVTPGEVERFRAQYCLAPELCRQLDISRATLARWENQGRISAVYSRRTHAGAGASLYLRAAAERLRAA